MAALRYREDRKVWFADQYDAAGKRKRIIVHITDTNLSHAENQVLAERKYQEIATPQKSRRKKGEADLGIYARDYIEWIKHTKAQTTATNERQRLNGTILPFFSSQGLSSLNSIEYRHLEQFVTSRKEEGRKHRTINGDIAVIRAFFKRAKQLGLIITDPATKIKKLSIITNAPKFYTKDELKELFSFISLPDQPYFKILLYTGIRRSELFNLTWDKVDLRSKKIYVGKKTYKERAVPLSPPAAEALKTIKGTSKGTKVFKYKSIDTLSQIWLRAVRSTGLSGTLHDLRHTYASHLVQSGIDL